MAVPAHDRQLSVPEFLKFARGRPEDEQWELLDGHAQCMAPATIRHGQLAEAFADHLKAWLRGHGCEPLVSRNNTGLQTGTSYVTPDVLIACAQSDDMATTVEHPVVIAEVLSRDWARDTHDKPRIYAQFPTLQLYVVIDQLQKHLLIFDRDGLDRQKPRDEHEALEIDIALPSGTHGLSLPLETLYQGINV